MTPSAAAHAPPRVGGPCPATPGARHRHGRRPIEVMFGGAIRQSGLRWRVGPARAPAAVGGGTTLVIRGPWGAARGRTAGDVTRRTRRERCSRRPLGITLLAAVLLAADGAGVAACWAAWPRTSNSSPLGGAVDPGVELHVRTLPHPSDVARLSPRGSCLRCGAGITAAVFSYIFPGGQYLLFPWFVITFLFASARLPLSWARGPTA